MFQYDILFYSFGIIFSYILDFFKIIFEVCINLHSSVAHQNQGIIVTAISLDIFIIIFQKVSDFDSLNSYISW